MPMDPMPRGALAVAIQQGIHTKVKQHTYALLLLQHCQCHCMRRHSRNKQEEEIPRM